MWFNGDNIFPAVLGRVDQVTLAVKLEPRLFPRLSSPPLYLRPFVSLNPIKVDLFGHASLLLSIRPKHLLGEGLAQLNCKPPPDQKHN